MASDSPIGGRGAMEPWDHPKAMEGRRKLLYTISYFKVRFFRELIYREVKIDNLLFVNLIRGNLITCSQSSLIFLANSFKSGDVKQSIAS